MVSIIKKEKKKPKERYIKKQVYNKFFDKSKWKRVNKYNKNALEDFILELKAEKKSEGTIYQYQQDIKIFFIWIYDDMGNVPVYKLTKKQLRKFLLDMQDKNMSSNRINRMKSCISSFFSYLEREEEGYEDFKHNHMSKIKCMQKETVREIIFLTPKQIDILRNRLIKDEKYQWCLLIDLLTETGIRHNEAYMIKKNWITEDSNYTTEKVIGKRRKSFYVCIHPRTRESYKLYMQQRGEDDVEELWITKNGTPASYEALYVWMLACRDLLKEETGKYIPFNLHSFRHYFIDGMIKGYNHLCKIYGKRFTLQEVQAMVSHSSSETTSSYMKNDEREIISDAFGW